MLAGRMKYLLFARMDYTVPRFAVSCSRCTTSCDLLRLGWLLTDSVKYKGAFCVQDIVFGAYNRQEEPSLMRKLLLCTPYFFSFKPSWNASPTRSVTL